MLRIHQCLLVVTTIAVIGCASPENRPTDAPPQDLVKAVRTANTAGDVAGGQRLVDEARREHGPTPTVLVAQSWVGRGALAAGDLQAAERIGQQTYQEATAALQTRRFDEEPHVPLALGASIELMANVAVARDARSEALAYLERELEQWGDTSIATRLQKNINLLSLEGTDPPALSRDEFLGEAPPPALDDLRGRVVLVFFWAHWCSDCKRQGPVIASLRERYGDRGLTVLAPTQRYGYVAGGRDADPAEERAYIADVWATSYPALADVSVHLDAANHRRYGVSTTPTLLLVDRAGRIRLYHPGQMSEEELEPLVQELLEEPRESS